MKYAYPVILTHEGVQYLARVPDLKSIHTLTGPERIPPYRGQPAR